eukprot:gnl/Spiro4/3717_TR1817_c0_g1_i1.p1 gnl/Spiro4/3717_TR1817_c0_g1~~gnl/Spiro4/3717_TR1817_c0_g1_i1.p1  ORF type:complete len:296 (+),score=100.36 gnl/Spiro4/3717_TR1817_c0_g1_i1:33-890(+)
MGSMIVRVWTAIKLLFGFGGGNDIREEDTGPAEGVGHPAGMNRNERRALNRMNNVRHRARNPDPQPPADLDDGADPNEGLTQRQIERAARRREREAALEEARTAKMEKEQARSAARAAKEEEREAARIALEEEELKRLAELKKKEDEEFELWSKLMVISEEGTAAQDVEQENQGLLGEFIDYIKTTKVCVISEMASKFKLPSESIISRLVALEEMGHITGVFDDRGKFIHVSHDEMQKIANFIKLRGRVSRTELANKSNELLVLEAAAPPPSAAPPPAPSVQVGA